MNPRNRAEVVDRNVVAWLEGCGASLRAGLAPSAEAPPVERPDEPVRPGHALTRGQAVSMFASMATSRHCDLIARALRARGEGFYTIGSSGHEGNVVLGEALRPDDPALVHYRSGALVFQRAKRAPGLFDALEHVVRGLVAAADEPIAGGRHKVFGSRPLWIIPLTSTIGSHLPRGLGLAFCLARANRLGLPVPVAADAIVSCGIGDASLNHSTVQGAINAAEWASYQRHPVPLLIVCEDNARGISVPSPHGWVEASIKSRPVLRYFHGDATDLPHAFDAALAAVACCRVQRRPVFLHLTCPRLLGHAGSDIEMEYRTLGEIEIDEARDPVLRAARLLVDARVLPPSAVLGLYEGLRARVAAAAERAIPRPKLRSAAQIVEPLAPFDADAVRREATRPPEADARASLFGGAPDLPEAEARPRHLAWHINRALLDMLAKYPGMILFGEDVGKKGGVYHVTAELQARAGRARVFDTLLDEQTILGIALGAGAMGLLPCPEIQYLAYVHNALDQLRGEACSMQFFSQAQLSNPMVVRIASFGYQKGFGGHFHNDNSIGALRDIPGLVIAAPARGDDAVGMLRESFALAQACGRVVAFLEPIALYMVKDLHETGDGGWLAPYPPPDHTVPLGRGRAHEVGGDDAIAIVSYANGLWLSLRAARRLREEGIAARVIDLRWLAPLDHDLVEEHVRATGRLLMVDECRRTGGGVADAVIAELALRMGGGGFALERVDGVDTYIPLGDAANLVLPAEDDIVAAGRRLAAAERPTPRPAAPAVSPGA